MIPVHKYNTFAKRLLACIADGILFWPLTLLIKWSGRMADHRMLITLSILYVSCEVLYVVIGHGKYGQTLGKRMMNIKVLDLHEQQVIGYRRAFIRGSVWFGARIAGVIMLIVAASEAVPGEKLPRYYSNVYFDIIIIAWFVLELATMFFNEKRRAVHDYIAGSVVIDLNEQQREDLQKRQQQLVSSLQS